MTGPRLDGKVAVVAGDGDGTAVVVTAAMEAAGAAVLTVPSYDDGAVAATIDRALTEHGGLHVLYCAATPSGSDDVASAHALAVMAAAGEAVPHLAAAGGGALILTVSTGALSADIVNLPTAIAESGLVAFNRATATLVGRLGVRCNVIAAGTIDTPATRADLSPAYLDAVLASNLVPRLGRPEDIAAMALFLASDDAEYVTGQVMRVDGGQLAHLPHYAHMIATGSTTTGGGTGGAASGGATGPGKSGNDDDDKEAAE